MKISLRRTAPVLLTLACTPCLLHAEPVAYDGHFYEVIAANSIQWNDANAAASMSVYAGAPGHLATITSAGEDQFIESLRSAAVLGAPEVWVGGYQEQCSPGPDCGWTWVNGEGPYTYLNWRDGEPNDDNGPGSEQYMAIGLRGEAGWNDEGSLGNIGGYVVEYDAVVVLDANDCVSGAGCNPVVGQTLVYPGATQLDNPSMQATSFQFSDDPARCGVSKLVLFGDDTDPNHEVPDLVIPPYLCGSPKFVVVRVASTGVEIPSGTIFVENDTAEVLPDNLYACESPIVQNFPASGDPQYQDVVAWQSTDHARMLEDELGAGVFEGALGEFTDGCGSSRGRVKSASYYVIGMHIDFGPGYEWAANTAGNHAMFVALTKYKLKLLQASVEEARPALNRLVYVAMRVLVDATIRLHDRDRYRAALLSTKLFLALAQNVRYRTVPGENYNGEHLMRGSNIEFMYTTKVIPYAP